MPANRPERIAGEAGEVPETDGRLNRFAKK